MALPAGLDGRRRHRLAWGIGGGAVAASLLLALWVVLTRPLPSIPPPVAAPAAEATSRLETMPCWFDLPAGRTARCGRLLVVDPAAGLPVELRYVVLAAGPGAAPDPIVYVNGGPGEAVGIDASGIARWAELAQSLPWLQQRDLVLFDKRGVGLSTPALECDELAEAGSRNFIEHLSDADADTLWRDAAVRCRQRLIASGIRLEAFDTAAIVSDLALLLDRLGYSRWNLYGISYGTRVVLDFMRSHPAGTRSVILDSVYPPDVQAYVESGANAKRAFDTLARRCQTEPDCNGDNPRLAMALQVAQRRAATDGFSAPVSLPGQVPQMAAIDDSKLIEILFYGFYQWSDIKRIPSVITALSQGDARKLAPLAVSAYQTAASPRSGYGAFLAVECRDEYPFNPPEAVRQQAAALPGYTGFMLSNLPVIVCPDWPVGQASAELRQPVHSDIPTLLLAGDVDPITPPGWAKHAAETLPHGTVFVFPGVGHGVIASHACAGKLATQFLAAPQEKPFDECLLALH